MNRTITLILLSTFWVVTEAFAMSFEDIPAQPPADAIMATQAELQQVENWAAKVFAGEDIKAPAPPVSIEVVRQDHNTLHFRQSCMDTVIKLGQQTYARGLGTHANSELVLGVPAGAKRFEAVAGIDNNYDTGGKRGSSVFLVEIAGKEVARTGVLKGSDAGSPVSVELPAGTDKITLKVDTTPDGPACDQSDWADARFVMADGTMIYADEGHGVSSLAANGFPFSFKYAGRSSAQFLEGWKREVTAEAAETFRIYRVRWTDPSTVLAVTAEVKVYKVFPAVDWVLYFENTGGKDTPLIEDIQALDLSILLGNEKLPFTVGHNRGDVFGETSFENVDTSLAVGDSFLQAPQNGRSSNGAFPFFDVRYGQTTLVAAVGWSGQWAMSVSRNKGEPVRVRAGMELTHLVLRPGERIRSPRILLTDNTCDVVTAHNRFRRLMLAHYFPQQKGRPVQLPVTLQCFDRYSWSVPEWATEAGQIDAVKHGAELGFDAHWFDAAWFPGGFPNGVGNWMAKPEAFPRGLKPVGDACHERGMKFILWFEPERVAPKTQIADEHPSFVFGGEKGGLYRLDQSDARRWLTDLLSSRIEEWGIDIYRNDFNIDPLSFWRANDAPDRQGMTEIRYTEGLYAMWDELLQRHPGLMIDNCASGGRRIDLEMCMRSVPFWRSDTNCFAGNADWNPGHSAGISAYLPLHMACGWAPKAYEIRAATTAGLICQLPYLDKDFPVPQVQGLIAEAKSLQKYWYGDLYPLVVAPVSPKAWSVFQLHRADLNEGIVLAFRRAQSPYTALRTELQALDPNATYSVERWTEEQHEPAVQMKGSELMGGIDLALARMSSSLIVRYAKQQ